MSLRFNLKAPARITDAMLLLCFPRLGTNGLLPASGREDWRESSPSDARRFRSAVPWGKILAPLKSVAKKNLTLKWSQNSSPGICRI